LTKVREVEEFDRKDMVALLEGHEDGVLQIQCTGQNLVGGFDSHALPPTLFRGSDKRHKLVVGDFAPTKSPTIFAAGKN
jgi:hypothetical protein